MIILHGWQVNIKMIILVLDNHADAFPDALNKMPKWQCFNQTKIITKWIFDQTETILQTEATVRLYLIWASLPNFNSPKFENIFHAAISSITWHAGGDLVPILLSTWHLHHLHTPCVSPASLPSSLNSMPLSDPSLSLARRGKVRSSPCATIPLAERPSRGRLRRARAPRRPLSLH